MLKTKPVSLAIVCCAAFTFIVTCTSCVRASGPELKTASTHPIQYYVSLPPGWTSTKKWPVVVVIESADREFLAAANEFAKASQRQPFILVTPLVVTNGGSGYRSVPTYHYSDAVWDQIEKSGPFTFDVNGINAIMKDVVQMYGGEEKFFVTGFEAGGHTVWGIVFNRPEMLRGAVLVCPNYLGRWVDEQNISAATERSNLPIRNFVGTNDVLCSPGKPIYEQMQTAIKLANSQGYKNVSVMRIEGRGHERLADEVLAYFAQIWSH